MLVGRLNLGVSLRATSFSGQWRWMAVNTRKAKKKKGHSGPVDEKAAANQADSARRERALQSLFSKSQQEAKPLTEEEAAAAEAETRAYSIATFRQRRMEQRFRHRLIESRMLAYYELPENRRHEADKLDLKINPLMFYQRLDSPPIQNYSHAIRKRLHFEEKERREAEDEQQEKKS
mmetsp:Transcript_19372/g.77408  ORF Transcript_19372/g.77408 Transcript_19372/m.77408 type:complete len:177 (-) Transcript_19372:1022-1552(-)|eukprot:CAMPEP_0113966214 /NCGR_PEP_ID=MMETSP0011_2-20120614/8204_1 /TAXON_ID=101924 /ORGANISM="Rhodosorus marinus" /LENGTH=176 /DNA_ID=CAMNT_0000978869 /DNA_START=84 /DNA_END=614 /DNA_ORIENTATION=- /assembly_acc=CAM_ASM_000156